MSEVVQRRGPQPWEGQNGNHPHQQIQQMGDVPQLPLPQYSGAQNDSSLPFWQDDLESPEHRHHIFQYHTVMCVQFANGYCPRHRVGKNTQMQCFWYHFESQRRRPIVDEVTGQLRYWDVMCERINAGEECLLGDRCPYAHTKEEISYHAAKYKTKLCNARDCRGQDVCCFAHGEAEVRMHAPARYSFWNLCGATMALRGPMMMMNPEDPSVLNGSAMGALYHPKVYKHRFCASFPNVGGCRRGTACAFAHSREEIRTPLLAEEEERQDPAALTDDFFMYKFKTLWCPVGVQHDWQTCVYAHNYQDARRHPGIDYGPRPCPYWKRKETTIEYAQRCPLGVRCPYSHGAKEQLYHPAYFKTVTCQDWPGSNCPRGKLCAFWHKRIQQRTQVMSDEDFDYKIPITEQKLNSSLQPDFLSPPFELLSTLQAEVQVRGMNGKLDGYGCQDPSAMGQMAMYSMCPPCFDAGTPSTAAGTPPSAGDSDEFNDSAPGDDGAGTPQQIRPRKNMSNPASPQQMMNGAQMQPFFPIGNGAQGMPPGAMMVPMGMPGSPQNCMPMGQQVVVYCVPMDQVPWIANGGDPSNGGEGIQVISAVDANGSPIAAQSMQLQGNGFCMLPASPTGGPMTGPCGIVEVPSPQMNMALQNGMNSPNSNPMQQVLAVTDGTNNEPRNS